MAFAPRSPRASSGRVSPGPRGTQSSASPVRRVGSGLAYSSAVAHARISASLQRSATSSSLQPRGVDATTAAPRRNDGSATASSGEASVPGDAAARAAHAASSVLDQAADDFMREFRARRAAAAARTQAHVYGGSESAPYEMRPGPRRVASEYQMSPRQQRGPGRSPSTPASGDDAFGAPASEWLPEYFNTLVETARSRWLPLPQVASFLRRGANTAVSIIYDAVGPVGPPVRPDTGSVFIVDERRLGAWREDGYAYEPFPFASKLTTATGGRGDGLRVPVMGALQDTQLVKFAHKTGSAGAAAQAALDMTLVLEWSRVARTDMTHATAGLQRRALRLPRVPSASGRTVPATGDPSSDAASFGWIWLVQYLADEAPPAYDTDGSPVPRAPLPVLHMPRAAPTAMPDRRASTESATSQDSAPATYSVSLLDAELPPSVVSYATQPPVVTAAVPAPAPTVPQHRPTSTVAPPVAPPRRGSEASVDDWGLGDALRRDSIPPPPPPVPSEAPAPPSPPTDETLRELRQLARAIDAVSNANRSVQQASPPNAAAYLRSPPPASGSPVSNIPDIHEIIRALADTDVGSPPALVSESRAHPRAPATAASPATAGADADEFTSLAAARHRVPSAGRVSEVAAAVSSMQNSHTGDNAHGASKLAAREVTTVPSTEPSTAVDADHVAAAPARSSPKHSLPRALLSPAHPYELHPSEANRDEFIRDNASEAASDAGRRASVSVPSTPLRAGDAYDAEPRTMPRPLDHEQRARAHVRTVEMHAVQHARASLGADTSPSSSYRADDDASGPDRRTSGYARHVGYAARHGGYSAAETGSPLHEDASAGSSTEHVSSPQRSIARSRSTRMPKSADGATPLSAPASYASASSPDAAALHSAKGASPLHAMLFQDVPRGGGSGSESEVLHARNGGSASPPRSHNASRVTSVSPLEETAASRRAYEQEMSPPRGYADLHGTRRSHSASPATRDYAAKAAPEHAEESYSRPLRQDRGVGPEVRSSGSGSSANADEAKQAPMLDGEPPREPRRRTQHARRSSPVSSSSRSSAHKRGRRDDSAASSSGSASSDGSQRRHRREPSRRRHRRRGSERQTTPTDSMAQPTLAMMTLLLAEMQRNRADSERAARRAAKRSKAAARRQLLTLVAALASQQQAPAAAAVAAVTSTVNAPSAPATAVAPAPYLPQNVPAAIAQTALQAEALSLMTAGLNGREHGLSQAPWRPYRSSIGSRVRVGRHVRPPPSHVYESLRGGFAPADLDLHGRESVLIREPLEKAPGRHFQSAPSSPAPELHAAALAASPAPATPPHAPAIDHSTSPSQDDAAALFRAHQQRLLEQQQHQQEPASVSAHQQAVGGPYGPYGPASTTASLAEAKSAPTPASPSSPFLPSHWDSPRSPTRDSSAAPSPSELAAQSPPVPALAAAARTPLAAATPEAPARVLDVRYQFLREGRLASLFAAVVLGWRVRTLLRSRKLETLRTRMRDTRQLLADVRVAPSPDAAFIASLQAQLETEVQELRRLFVVDGGRAGVAELRALLRVRKRTRTPVRAVSEPADTAVAGMTAEERAAARRARFKGGALGRAVQDRYSKVASKQTEAATGTSELKDPGVTDAPTALEPGKKAPLEKPWKKKVRTDSAASNADEDVVVASARARDAPGAVGSRTSAATMKPSARWRVVVEVVEARGLPTSALAPGVLPSGPGMTKANDAPGLPTPSEGRDTFAQAFLSRTLDDGAQRVIGKKLPTATVSASTDPVWHRTFVFSLPLRRPGAAVSDEDMPPFSWDDWCVCTEVLDADRFARDTHLGQASVSLADLSTSAPCDSWLPLRPTRESERVKGQVHIRASLVAPDPALRAAVLAEEAAVEAPTADRPQSPLRDVKGSGYSQNALRRGTVTSHVDASLESKSFLRRRSKNPAAQRVDWSHVRARTVSHLDDYLVRQPRAGQGRAIVQVFKAKDYSSVGSKVASGLRGSAGADTSAAAPTRSASSPPAAARGPSQVRRGRGRPDLDEQLQSSDASPARRSRSQRTAPAEDGDDWFPDARIEPAQLPGYRRFVSDAAPPSRLPQPRANREAANQRSTSSAVTAEDVRNFWSRDSRGAAPARRSLGALPPKGTRKSAPFPSSVVEYDASAARSDHALWITDGVRASSSPPGKRTSLKSIEESRDMQGDDADYFAQISSTRAEDLGARARRSVAGARGAEETWVIRSTAERSRPAQPSFPSVFDTPAPRMVSTKAVVPEGTVSSVSPPSENRSAPFPVKPSAPTAPRFMGALTRAVLDAPSAPPPSSVPVSATDGMVMVPASFARALESLATSMTSSVPS